MKIGIFGDVHGCVDEMRHVVNTFKSAGVEKIVSLGDLTDRGPDSEGCVELWAEAKSFFPHSTMIRGNHDDKVLRAARHTRNLLKNGRKIPMNMDRVDPWMLTEHEGQPISWLVGDERGEAILKVLEDSVLFEQHGDYAFVHGGIPPRMRRVPSRIHKSKDFMYCRYVADEDGRMVALGDEGEIPHHFWADDYDGRFGKVFFGHQPHDADEVFKYEHAVAMDTSCVFGGVLTGIVLDDVTGEMEIMQFAPKEQYAERRRA